MDAREQELVRESVRAAVADDDPAVALDALGWDDLYSTDPRVAVAITFEELGRAARPSAMLDRVVLDTSGVDDDGVAVAHPLHADRDERPPVCGLLLARGDQRATRGVVVFTGAGASLVPPDAVVLEPIEGIAPNAGLVRVTAIDWPPGAERTADAAGVVAAARRALAHELVGVADAALATAVSHVSERHQFGRPLAAFQAVRHRLADAHVAVEAARGAVAAAWEDGSTFAAAVAKALAGRAARAATATAQQVCGAIGFTWEHGLHCWVRRALLLDQLYGSADELVGEAGRHVLDARRAPRLLPLG